MTRLLLRHCRKGDQFKSIPIANIVMALMNIFFKKTFVPAASNRGITKDMALPTAKRKKGNTISVGVQPCHGACSSGV